MRNLHHYSAFQIINLARRMKITPTQLQRLAFNLTLKPLNLNRIAANKVDEDVVKRVILSLAPQTHNETQHYLITLPVLLLQLHQWFLLTQHATVIPPLDTMPTPQFIVNDFPAIGLEPNPCPKTQRYSLIIYNAALTFNLPAKVAFIAAWHCANALIYTDTRAPIEILNAVFNHYSYYHRSPVRAKKYHQRCNRFLRITAALFNAFSSRAFVLPPTFFKPIRHSLQARINQKKENDNLPTLTS